MSYSDKQMGRERFVSAGLVVLVQGGVIAALVSGLAMSVIPKLDTPLTTYAVPEPAPPPPDPAKPRPEAHARPAEPAVTQPLQIVPLPLDPAYPTFERLPVEVTQPDPVESPRAVPADPDLARAAAARGSVGDWFPQDSYPAAALRDHAEGRVGVAVTVLASGRASGCEVVSSSGNSDLDQATCRLAIRNGRFQPARDQAGNAVAARIVLPPVRWRIVN